MKKILFLQTLAATAFAATLAACSDNDNNGSNPGIIDNPVTSDETAISTVNGVYSQWQPLSSSFSFIIELNSNSLISFEGEESEAGPQRTHTNSGGIRNHVIIFANINTTGNQGRRGKPTEITLKMFI